MLKDIALISHLYIWMLDFLTSRQADPKWLKSMIPTSSLSQGHILSPLLYSLFTHDCVSKHSFSIIFKFVSNTTILGQIMDEDEVRALAEWCSKLCLNISKTEMIIDHRRLQEDGHNLLIHWQDCCEKGKEYQVPLQQPDLVKDSGEICLSVTLLSAET